MRIYYRAMNRFLNTVRASTVIVAGTSSEKSQKNKKDEHVSAPCKYENMLREGRKLTKDKSIT